MDFLPRCRRCHVDRDRVVEKREARQVRDDARPGPLRPAGKRQHRVELSVEKKTTIRLGHPFTVPSGLLNCERGVERGRAVALGCEPRIEETPEGKTMATVIQWSD
jgi:hypothetical protein